MVSLGNECYAGKLMADSIQVRDGAQSSYKKIGPAKNEGEIHHNGSIFYIKWGSIHQVTQVQTTDASAYIKYTSATHGNLQVGDTIHISNSFSGPDVGGIPVSELTGEKLVAAKTATTFTIATSTPANTTATHAETPLVKIDRYKYIDLDLGYPNEWSSSTTLPSPSHTNTEVFYL